MIELSRYIPFGQYVNNGSLVIRLDPRTKLVSAVLLIGCISFINSFLAFALCLIYCFILQRTSRISPLYVLRSITPFIVFLLFAFVMQVLFYLSPKGTPLLWSWWVLSISWKGIIMAVLTMIRVLFLYYLAAMLTLTTSLVDLTDGMEVLLAPLRKIGIPVNAFIMIIVIALKFVPIFVSEIERLIKAQAARGMNFGQGNLFQRVSKLSALLIPLFVSAFKRVKTVTVAMEARCFGGRPNWQRSKRRTLTFTRVDVWALVLTIVFCGAMVVINSISPF
ncbi:MAG TPA: energy-coupling factor transporter transmembrane component T [Ktedonobacteraceae bacterium]